MKKSLLILAVIVVPLVLAGCNKPATETSQTTPTPAVSISPSSTRKGDPIPQFKQKALVKTTKDGSTTETLSVSIREVELTPEQEEQYYGDHPEYKGWGSAYKYSELFRYPEGWGYHVAGRDHLLSNDSGENSNTVVSITSGVNSIRSEYWDHDITLNAEIGYIEPSKRESRKMVKVDKLQTTDKRNVAKLKQVYSSGNVVLEYIIEHPHNQNRVTHINVNPMNPDVFEKNEHLIDEVIRSFNFVPYQYQE